MSHDYHEAHPGYSPEQVLHDGCGECEYRSKHTWVAISYLDAAAFAAAWERAARYEHGDLGDVSSAEVPVLRALWAVQVQFERRGVPIGELPGSAEAPADVSALLAAIQQQEASA